MKQKAEIKNNWNPDKDKNIKGDPKKTIFVGRLNYKTDEKKLHDHFEIYGGIKNVNLVKNIHTEKSRGYAFIEYQDQRSAEIAY